MRIFLQQNFRIYSKSESDTWHESILYGSVISYVSNVAKTCLFVAVFLQVSIVLIAYVILSKGWHMGVACLDVNKLLMSEAPIMVYGSAA